MHTIWEDVQMPEFPPLENDLCTDVLIVGGGLAGLLCAWSLKRAGADCTLIEENRLMHGVSGRTTAKITSQHGLIYSKLLRNLGPERARLYWQANEEALHVYRELAKTADFDFQTQCSCIYATGGTEALEEEGEAYARLGIPAQWETALPLPFKITGALSFPNQAQMHPMKLAAHIAQGLNIYENTKAVAFKGNTVQTLKGTITAKKIVVATHFPILNKHGMYFMKLYQQRSYVLALRNAEEIEGMYLDSAPDGLSVRSAGRYLLLGGGGHRTGKRGRGLAWKTAEDAAAQFFPHARVAARWATQDCMTLDGMPYIGCYSKGLEDLYVATGFGKWGMSTSMAAAMILTDLIRGRENPYAELFSPSRSMLGRQLLINAAETAGNFVHPTRPRCPHLGCALVWNTAEHSWDCPCHGSRFDRDGKCLNNPATDDLKHPPKR